MRSENEESKFCPPIEKMKGLKKLSIHQKIDWSKWMAYNVGLKLLDLDQLEEFELYEGNNALHYE